MSKKMHGCSLWQPHASLIVAAAIDPAKGKNIETRHWSPLAPVRRLPGLPATLAIHAAGRFPREMKERCLLDPHFIRAMFTLGFDYLMRYGDLMRLPRNAFVAVADLVAVHETPPALPLRVIGQSERNPYLRVAPFRDSAEAAFGNYEPGRFIWFLENIRRLEEPLPEPGRQGLWPLAPDIVAQIEERIVR
jgi:hypothetical protein